MKILKAAMVSWKTTAVGVLMFIAELARNLVFMLDNDAATVPDWNLVIVAFTVMIGLFASKDADKSTEDHGL